MFTLSLVVPPNRRFIKKKYLKDISDIFSAVLPETQNGCIHISFVPEDTMIELNAHYRNKPVNTDVLSFAYTQNFETVVTHDVV